MERKSAWRHLPTTENDANFSIEWNKLKYASFFSPCIIESVQKKIICEARKVNSGSFLSKRFFFLDIMRLDFIVVEILTRLCNRNNDGKGNENWKWKQVDWMRANRSLSRIHIENWKLSISVGEDAWISVKPDTLHTDLKSHSCRVHAQSLEWHLFEFNEMARIFEYYAKSLCRLSRLIFIIMW